MKIGAPYKNKNSEKWTLEESERFFLEAIELSNKKTQLQLRKGDSFEDMFGYEFDFIGEIARELDSYIDVFDYLVGKFPELSILKNKLMRNCEANCFSNAKKGFIKEASAIMNLKSNHKWTDRSDITTKEKEIQSIPTIVFKDFKND